MENHISVTGTKKPLLTALTVFFLIGALTLALAWQNYLIKLDKKRSEAERELDVVNERVNTILGYDLSATKTLAFIVSHYGVPKDFNAVAKTILESNRYIDALELTEKGVITHVYPFEENKQALGYDVLSDSLKKNEALKALKSRQLFFAGPLTLRQGGKAIIGRLPIFRNDEFLGFSVVIVKMSTLLRTLGIDTLHAGFNYQLSKINPFTNQEEFFLPPVPFPGEKQSASVQIAEGDWKLYVIPKESVSFFNTRPDLLLLGFLFAVVCGSLAYHMAKQPEKLKALVAEKTTQLLASEKYYRSLIEKSADAIVLSDASANVIYQTASTEQITGYSLAEMKALHRPSLIHPDDREKDLAAFNDLVKIPGCSVNMKHRFKHKNGTYIWLEGKYTNLLHDENIKAVVYNYYDVTQRIESEKKAESAQRLYEVSSRINHLMIRVKDKDTLFKESCNIAIDIGKFKMAWLGMIDEKEKKIIPVAFAGDTQNYLEKLDTILLTDPLVSSGPSGLSVSTGTYVYSNDIENDPRMKPWADEALLRGYRSSISLPIKKSGSVIGTYTLYAGVTNYFDAKEIDLLNEITENIAFTLDNFENEKRRREAEQGIAAEKLLSDSIINSLPGVFYLYDNTGKFLRWNTNFEAVSGYSKEEMRKRTPLDFFDEAERPLVEEKINQVFTSGSAEINAAFYTKNRQKIPYYFNGRRFNYNGINYLIGMGIDITDRVKTEHELIARTEEIQKLTAYLESIREEERTRISREIHDELGQQLTGLKMDATWILKKLAPANEDACDKIAVMISLIDETIKTVRRISSELRPGILDDLGLVAALEWQAHEFEKRTGIISCFYSQVEDLDPGKTIATNVFRIYQEALTNITRHAGATKIETRVEINDNFMYLTVKDNGRGFSTEEVGLKKTLGLLGMKERAFLFNGQLSITSERSKGTVITLKVPVYQVKNTL